jgi:hypothetical protein
LSRWNLPPSTKFLLVPRLETAAAGLSEPLVVYPEA